MESTKKGRGKTLFISGEAGSGKTRLVAEFLKTIKKEEIMVLSGWCLSDAAIPYFPFVEAFESYMPTNDSESLSVIGQRASLKSWLWEAHQIGESNQEPRLWKERAFHGVTRELLLLSAKKPLVLILEDVHWADSASLALLHYLSRQVYSERILLLATFRTEEAEIDAKGNLTQLAKLLLLMGRDNLCNIVKLPKIGEENVGKIACSMLGGQVDAHLIERLTSDSDGNPLFIVETLRLLFQQGSLERKNAGWTLSDDQLVIPQKVKDLFLRRLDNLTFSQRKILDVASVIGERFDARLVSAVVSSEYTDSLIALNTIMKKTLIIRCENEGYRFEHMKYREMLYNEIPVLLRKAYHSLIANEIELLNQSFVEISANELAHHYIQAGKRKKAIEYSLQAGKIALSTFSNVEAIKHFKYVVDACKDDKELISEKVSAIEGLGEAFLSSSLFEESIKTFRELAQIATTDSIRLRAFRKAMDSAFHLGNISHMKELIQKAQPFAAADRLEHARILLSKGRAFHLQSMLPQATEEMIKALQVFEEEYSLWDVGLSLIGLGIYHTGADKSFEGIAESLRATSIFEELRDTRLKIEACYIAGMSFNFCFLEQEALKMFAKAIEIDCKEKIYDYLRLTYTHSFSSRSHEALGEFEKAVECSLEALKLSRKTDSPLAKAVVYSDLTRLYARLGKTAQAKEAFKWLKEIPADILVDPRTIIDLAKPVLYAARNGTKRAQQLFQKLLEEPYLSKSPAFILTIVKQYYAWFLERIGKDQEAQSVYNDIQKRHLEFEEKFKPFRIRAYFMVPTKVNTGQPFEARLDIINVSKSRGLIKRVEGLIHTDLEFTEIPPQCILKNDGIDIAEEKIDPFQVKTIKFHLITQKPKQISLYPKVIYTTNPGQPMICDTRRTKVDVVPTPAILPEQIMPQLDLRFQSDSAKKAFDFLLKSLLEDYRTQKMTLEDSGWRTLIDISNKANISKYSVYGRSGKSGKVLSELFRLRLVESRYFFKERGRGGRILKVRILNKEKLTS